MTTPSWTELAADPKPIEIAFEAMTDGVATYAITFALRRDDVIWVQTYFAPGIEQPLGSDRSDVTFARPIFSVGGRFRERPAKMITSQLSPARILADLLQWAEPECLSRVAGDARYPRRRTAPGGKAPRDPVPTITLCLTGHGLDGKWLRLGSQFLRGLLAPTEGSPAIGVGGGAVTQFRDPRACFAPPVVEFVVADGVAVAIRLAARDLDRVSGPCDLADQAQSLLGLAPGQSRPERDRAALHRRALRNTVEALLVAEQLEIHHREIASALGLPSERIPTMHGTPGLRASTLMLHDFAETAARGSVRLGAKEADNASGLGKIKTLAEGGGADALSDGRVTRYGPQTGDCHGGLLYSRSPIQYFHAAPGQFRDVDMAHCYPAILARTPLFVGRPVVFEPGNDVMTLREILPYLERNAAGADAWFVKVSGPIIGFRNTLVPSTLSALTNDTYRNPNSGRRLRSQNVKLLGAKRSAHERGAGDDLKGTALLTAEVQAGVVTHATALMIRALPPKAQEQYLNLRAETIVFYPARLVAGSGAEYDSLCEQFTTGAPVDWHQALDLDGRTRTTVEAIDEKFVCLRYDLGGFAESLIARRLEIGKNSGQGRMLKVLGNSLYGTIASPFLPLGNVVAANVVTGKARALAYAMAQSLNAFAVNTDGVLLRCDRIPAVPFAKCLALSPNYPLQQACGESRIPFLQAEAIPEDDTGFTEWYREHVAAFFGVAGRPEYAALFGLHNVEHKLTSGAGAAFDALFLDGVANHGKVARTTEGNWTARDFKARGIPKAAKMEVAEKLLRVYERDRFEAPLELVPAERTLDAAGATAAVRGLVEGGAEVAHWPLGLSVPARVSYKLVKPSQFLFRTAAQRKGMMAAWKRLVLKTDCGFELLSLRKTFGNSLTEVARAIFDLIEKGHVDLAGLNLDRLWRPGELGLRRKADAEVLRSADRQRFVACLVVDSGSPERTGLQVGLDGLLKLLPPL